MSPLAKTEDRVEFYKDADNKWRWRFRAGGNNKVLADSSQGYSKKSRCLESAEIVMGRVLEFEHPEDVTLGSSLIWAYETVLP